MDEIEKLADELQDYADGLGSAPIIVHDRAELYGLLARAAAALRSAQVPEWRPIETAPKDGTSILAWRFYSVAIRWRPDLDGEFPWDAVSLESHPSTNFTTNGFMEDDRALTHWMPLPSPPRRRLRGV